LSNEQSFELMAFAIEVKSLKGNISVKTNRPSILGEVSESSLADRLEKSETALTVRQLAGILQVSDQSLYRAIAAGQIPVIQVGGIFRLAPREVAEWIRRQSR
jgi:excisionase family DNA binding protein